MSVHICEELENGWCHECETQVECNFPSCGCDGSRLCQAEEGASDKSFAFNIEGRINPFEIKNLR